MAEEDETCAAPEGPQRAVTIHGKVYDITDFNDHPGGPDFLKIVHGKDATTHFEMHHMRIQRARSRLARLPVITEFDITPDWDWSYYGFYATVRRQAAVSLLKEVGHPATNEKDVADASDPIWRKATTSTKAMRISRIFAIICYVVSFVMTCQCQSAVAAFTCGVLTAVMGGFGHNALHQRGRTWDCWLFECSGMSHQEYRIEDHMSHHMYPNLPNDPDASSMLPFVEFGPPRRASIFRRIFSVLAFHALAALAGLSMLGRRLMFPTRRHFRGHSGIVVPLIKLFLLMLSDFLMAKPYGMLHSFSLWLLLWLSASFYFMLVTTVTHNQENNWMTLPETICDCGMWQMATATDIQIPFGLRGVPLCGMMMIFLHEQTLHHLFPTVDHSRLPLLRPVVSRAAENFGFELQKPQNYLSLYIGMLTTIGGGTSKLKKS